MKKRGKGKPHRLDPLRFEKRRDMVISPHKVIFIHIPKTGGMSIRRSLLGERVIRHATLRAYKKMDPEYFHEAYKFAIVRNPFDRIVSSYHFSRQKKNGNRLATEATSFVDFCQRLKRYHLTTDLAGMIQQSWWITDEFHRVAVDDVYPFEHLGAAIKRVQEITGLPGELKHINASEHDPWESYHTDETREVVEELFGYDVLIHKRALEAWDG